MTAEKYFLSLSPLAYILSKMLDLELRDRSTAWRDDGKKKIGLDTAYFAIQIVIASLWHSRLNSEY